jgi:hypothetical protein
MQSKPRGDLSVGPWRHGAPTRATFVSETGGPRSNRPTHATRRGCAEARLRLCRSPQRPGFRPGRRYVARTVALPVRGSRPVHRERRAGNHNGTRTLIPYFWAISSSVCHSACACESRVRHQCLDISVWHDWAVNLGLDAGVQHAPGLASGRVRPVFRGVRNSRIQTAVLARRETGPVRAIRTWGARKPTRLRRDTLLQTTYAPKCHARRLEKRLDSRLIVPSRTDLGKRPR